MIHDFCEDLNFSEGIDIEENLVIRLLDMIPGSVEIKKASTKEDKSGTDYWIIRKPPLRPVSIVGSIR